MKETLQKLPNILKWSPKWRNFAKYGHTGQDQYFREMTFCPKLLFLFQGFYSNRRRHPFALFLKWTIPGLFFFIFVFSIQLTVNIQYQFLLMTGFELQTSRIGSDRSTNIV